MRYLKHAVFLFVYSLTAQVTVTFGGATATQAILTYTAPNSSACTLIVSTAAGLTPIVHDLDTTLFTGSNLDSRAGNPNNGTARVFVIGLRTAGLASDGNFYSRALQANTLHYYQVTCGSSVGSGQFLTGNANLGNSYTDLAPFNSSASFNY